MTADFRTPAIPRGGVNGTKVSTVKMDPRLRGDDELGMLGLFIIPAQAGSIRKVSVLSDHQLYGFIQSFRKKAWIPTARE